jgi:hypothetical protein
MAGKVWTIEEISAWPLDKVRQLRINALARNGVQNVALCDAVIHAFEARGTAGRKKRTGPSGDRSPFLATDDAVDRLAKFFRTLPQAETHEGVRERRRRQEHAKSLTLAGLWRTYLVCAFSSQSESSPGSHLWRFENDPKNAGAELLDLSNAIAAHFATEWVQAQLKAAKLGRYKTKSRIVERAHPHFTAAGQAGDLLAGIQISGPMAVFAKLARGELGDSDIAASQAFSSSLDTKPFYQVGMKQLRNILCNTGLAMNVVPLDSRWVKQLAADAEISVCDHHLAHPASYLAIEQLLRKALVRAREVRQDIRNLAEIDALVFGRANRRKA